MDRTARRLTALTVFAVLAPACASTGKLIKATADFSNLAKNTLGEVGGAPGIIHDLCDQRVEIEYVTRRLLPNPVASLDEFYTHPLSIGDGRTTTWRALCDGYSPADAAFGKALAALTGYAAQLGEVTGKDYAPSVNFATLAADASDDATKLSGDYPRYKDAVVGIGAPLGKLADAIAIRWIQSNLAPIVERADAPLQELIKHLIAFVTIVRTQQLADNRAAFAELRDELDALNQQKPELVSAVMIALVDVEISHRLAQSEAKLRSLEDLLAQLAKAHATLRTGWLKGDRTGLATIKQLAGITKDAYADVKHFENPLPPP